jgi:hypothetical protein
MGVFRLILYLIPRIVFFRTLLFGSSILSVWLFRLIDVSWLSTRRLLQGKWIDTKERSISSRLQRWRRLPRLLQSTIALDFFLLLLVCVISYCPALAFVSLFLTYRFHAESIKQTIRESPLLWPLKFSPTFILDVTTWLQSVPLRRKRNYERLCKLSFVANGCLKSMKVGGPDAISLHARASVWAFYFFKFRFFFFVIGVLEFHLIL